jgi:hypothetical protein
LRKHNIIALFRNCDSPVDLAQALDRTSARLEEDGIGSVHNLDATEAMGLSFFY